MRELSQQEQRQKLHYETIGEAYDLHYSDGWSLRYRDEFMHAPMVEGLDLRGMKVLEAMCGAGHAAKFLQERGAEVIGLDISETQLAAFQANCSGASTLCASILDTGLESESLDLVIAVGGLHHLHPHLDSAVEEIYRILKPGGYFCFCDPHSGSLPDIARSRWYRADPLFAEEEAPVNVDLLRRTHSDRFLPEVERYMGNVAYIAVLNSMVLRMPLSLKALYSPLCMILERAFNRFLPALFACYACCRWRKI